MTNEQEIEFVNNKLSKATFQFAKTMRDIPHEYTLRTTWKDVDEFFLVVELMRKYAYVGYFFNKAYLYYDIEQYKYWTMGSPVKETILINRAKK